MLRDSSPPPRHPLAVLLDTKNLDGLQSIFAFLKRTQEKRGYNVDYVIKGLAEYLAEPDATDALKEMYEAYVPPPSQWTIVLRNVGVYVSACLGVFKKSTVQAELPTQ